MEYVNFNCPDCPKTHTCSLCERRNRNIANGTTPVKDLWTGEMENKKDMMETTLYEAPGFRGFLRLKKNKSSSHSGYLQYVEVEKDGSERVVYESRELYTAYEEGTEDILEAVKEFYNSDKTKIWLANVRIEDDLYGSNHYEGIIQGLLDFCLSL